MLRRQPSIGWSPNDAVFPALCVAWKKCVTFTWYLGKRMFGMIFVLRNFPRTTCIQYTWTVTYVPRLALLYLQAAGSGTHQSSVHSQLIVEYIISLLIPIALRWFFPCFKYSNSCKQTKTIWRWQQWRRLLCLRLYLAVLLYYIQKYFILCFFTC